MWAARVHHIRRVASEKKTEKEYVTRFEVEWTSSTSSSPKESEWVSYKAGHSKSFDGIMGSTDLW